MPSDPRLCHNQLLQLGVTKYSWNKAWNDYRQGRFVGIIMAVAASVITECTPQRPLGSGRDLGAHHSSSPRKAVQDEHVAMIPVFPSTTMRRNDNTNKRAAVCFQCEPFGDLGFRTGSHRRRRLQ